MVYGGRVKEEGSIYDPFSFRPPQDVAAPFAEFCEQLGYRKTQALSACLEAVLEMIDAQEPQVPRLVTMVRTLRRQQATLSDEPRPFAAGLKTVEAGKVVPFLTVQPPPDHVLVPLYGSISAGYPGTGTPQEQPLEYVAAASLRSGSPGIR